MKIPGKSRADKIKELLPNFCFRVRKIVVCKITNIHLQPNIFMTGATRNIFLLYLILASLVGSGQNIYYVSGKVTDSKTKEPLAFVNIVINNSQYGGTTDIDGKFRLRNAYPVQKLQLSYVGYLPLTYSVGNKTENLSIQLTRTEIELTEVDIFPGINPAHRIIRNVIENRDQNDPEKLNSFSYTSYDKTVFTAEADTSINKEFKDTLTQKHQHEVLLFSLPASDTLTIDSTRTDSNNMALKNLLNKQFLFLMENVTKRKFLAPDKNYNQVIATRMS